MTELASKTCTPCQGGVEPLSLEAADRLRGQVPDWKLLDQGRRLERTWRFKDFAEAYALVRKASELAEAEGHHPDITFGWGYCTVSVYTHKIGGLHENDFILAAKLDAAADG